MAAITGTSRPTDPEKTERVRRLCSRLPGVTERVSHGEPAWFVAGKLFATTADHHHDDRLGLWCAAPLGAQEALVETAPERFFRPPYVGHRGWLGVYLDVDGVDWEELGAIIEAAYRQVAPKRLQAQLGAR
jgi:hypothetical protein